MYAVIVNALLYLLPITFVVVMRRSVDNDDDDDDDHNNNNNNNNNKLPRQRDVPSFREPINDNDAWRIFSSIAFYYDG